MQERNLIRIRAWKSQTGSGGSQNRQHRRQRYDERCCWSLTPDAEDVVVVLLGRVAFEASGAGVLADHRAGWVACGEAFKAPAAGSGEPLAVLLHNAEHLAFALRDRVVGRSGFEQVKEMTEPSANDPVR